MAKSKLVRKRVRSNSKKSRVSKQVGGNKLRRNTQMRKRKSISRKRKSKRSNKNKKYTKKHRGGADAGPPGKDADAEPPGKGAAKDAPGIVVNSPEDREILSKFISVTDFIEELKTTKYVGNFFIYLKDNEISIESKRQEESGDLIFQHVDELIPAAIREASELSDWDAASNNEDLGEATRAASLTLASARTASGVTQTDHPEIKLFLLPDLPIKKKRINNLITALTDFFKSEDALNVITPTAVEGAQQEAFEKATADLVDKYLEQYIVPDKQAAGAAQPAMPNYIARARNSQIQSFPTLVVDICHRIGLARQGETLILVHASAEPAAAPAAAAAAPAAPAAAAAAAAPAADVENAVPNASAGTRALPMVPKTLRGIEHFRMGSVYNFETLYDHIRNILLLNSYHNRAKPRLRAAQPSKINAWFDVQIGILLQHHQRMGNSRNMELGAEHFTNLFNYILKASVEEPAQRRSLQFIIFIVEMIITIREARMPRMPRMPREEEDRRRTPDTQDSIHKTLVEKYITLKESIETFLGNFTPIDPSHAYFVTSKDKPPAPEFKNP